MAKRYRNITKRGGVWYFSMLYKGIRHSQSLETSDKEVAGGRAKLMREKIISRQWDQRLGLVVRGVATVGEVLAVFKQYAVGRLDEGTAKDYANALRLVVRRGLGKDEMKADAVDSESANVLTAGLVREYESWMLQAAVKEVEATGDGSKLASAKRSINSYLRQARAVFTTSALQFYKEKDLVLPDAALLGFLKAPVVEEPKLNRRAPSEEEVRPLFQAAKALKTEDPDAYIAWLLAAWTGLRRGDLASVQRSWLVQMNGHWVFNLPEGWQKNGEADTVPVHPNLAAELQWYFKQSAGKFVLPSPDIGHGGDDADLRASAIFNRVYEWMRGLGWTDAKMLQAMRRYFGDQARDQHGEEWTKALMRHAEGSTLRRNYIGKRELTGKYVELPLAALLPLEVPVTPKVVKAA